MEGSNSDCGVVHRAAGWIQGLPICDFGLSGLVTDESETRERVPSHKHIIEKQTNRRGKQARTDKTTRDQASSQAFPEGRVIRPHTP